MKDAEIAIEMLNCAHRRVKSGQRCEEFMRHVMFYSPQYIGLARKAQREYATARMLLQAARRVHPATTPKAPKRARPVPPKTGPAAQYHGPALLGANAQDVHILRKGEPLPRLGESSILYVQMAGRTKRPGVVSFSNPSGPSPFYDSFLGDKK